MSEYLEKLAACSTSGFHVEYKKKHQPTTTVLASDQVLGGCLERIIKEELGRAKKEVNVWGTKAQQHKGMRENVKRDNTIDRTWLASQQQETTTRRVREVQVYLDSRNKKRKNALTT